MHIEIIPMSPQHLTPVAELERLCFSNPWSLDALQESLAQNLYHSFVAVTPEGNVAGYVGLQIVLDEGSITNVAVFPAFRRHGIASKLLTHVQTVAKNRALSFITLEVRASNTSAIACYQKHGFQVVGRRPNFYTHPTEDALLMMDELHKKEQSL